MTDASKDTRVRVHLHKDDCPVTLGLLQAVIRGRPNDGFETTDSGAYVEWVEIGARLSSTEDAVVRIAQGLAIIERHGGGVPERLRGAVIDAVAAVV
jgi:hypothetical protein